MGAAGYTGDVLRFHTRQLLVGLVESDLSDHAVHAAARVARAFRADLEVVHAVSVPPVLWPGVSREQLTRLHAGVVRAAEERLVPRLRALEQRFDLEPDELVSRLHTLAGDSTRVLLERQEATSADALFVGSHEKRGVLDFGHTTRTLLHRAHRPIWLQPAPWAPIERILAPVDFSAESRVALGAAVTLAQGFGAEVSVLHVFEPPSFAFPADVAAALGWPAHPEKFFREKAEADLARFVQETEWHDVVHRHEFVDGDPEETILERSRGAQLVVMGSRGATHVLGPLLGHVTYAVLRQSKVPVLALRD